MAVAFEIILFDLSSADARRSRPAAAIMFWERSPDMRRHSVDKHPLSFSFSPLPP